MKKLISFVLAAMLVFSFSAAALAADGDITISLRIGSTTAIVNGTTTTVDVAPEVVEVNGGGVTFVPVRFITENFGLVNNWNASAPNDVVLTGNGFNGKITIGSTEATINGEAKTLLAAPYSKDGRTMVPLRFLSENLGYFVNFDATISGISVSTNPAAKPEAIISSADYAYLAGTDFRSIKRDYSTAEAQCAYVYAYTNKNGELCVLTQVQYKIISNYSKLTLHNMTTGQTISDPANYYDKLADRAFGANKSHYMSLYGEILGNQIKMLEAMSNALKTGVNNWNGVYVTAAELNK